ncbi:protein HIRA [Clarias gariepinus]|uniref:protein HIRA isoform X2 n=1 Tax=Clarias gariepinus TaxID=13013 RepID=UPI00234C6749|nr:protein HIRA isoform X2 [Clarias gariepinus]
MKLLKPSWVAHNGKPIFSVDIHPDGTKFATGGQGEDSGKVVIWNMAPVLREEDEKNENVPKLLCQMDNHLACVNCVRWSNNGQCLASGGDDKLVMVWKKATFIGPSTVFGSSSKLANVEQWRCVTILRNHTGDVMDVAWSPHDVWLASCSVDNTIVIWNARKFPEMVTSLSAHSGLVKGLSWDPVGKYVASQADDRSLKVWRTIDWQLEANITKPFTECGGTTHVLRLSWSPDGQYLVSAHAMNNSGPTAQIIERDGWKTNMDFVGHRKAVTVVKFNPKIFKKKPRNGSSSKPTNPYCCCAVGSKDRSLSVWLTSLKRPLVVIHDLFDKSIMDITWTLSGLGLLVCSMDGTVAFLDFSQDELGDPLNEEEKNTIHQKMYGKSLAITTETQLSSTIIENPEMLKYQQETRISIGTLGSSAETPLPKLSSVVNGESLEDIRKNLLKKQVETRTADGRRRITPLCIAQLDTGDFSPALFNSAPILPGSSVTQLSSDSNTSLSLRVTHDAPAPSQTKPTPEGAASSQSKGTADNKDGCGALKSPLLLTAASKIEPMKALDSRFTERSKVTPGLSSSPAAVSTAPVDRIKDGTGGRPEGLKDWKAREDSSSDSEEKAVQKVAPPLGKRRNDLDGGEVVEKRKKGRPRKDSKMMMSVPQVYTQTPVPVEKETSRASAPVAAIKLHTPAVQKSFSTQVGSDPVAYLEVDNELCVVAGSRISQLRFSTNGRDWNTVLTSRVVTATASSDVVAVACEDRTLSVFSACGRRLVPPIMLSAPITVLHCSAHFVMALTASATLSVWDVQKQVALVKNESLNSILSGSDTVVSSMLTGHGVPVVTLSNGRSYCFSSTMETWNLIVDKQDTLVQCADFSSCLSSHDALGCTGPLATTQGRNLSAGRLASRLSSTPHHVQQVITLSFLENQLSSARILHSANEYRHWLLIYARFLVNEGYEQRLRELCKDLLGPVHKSSGSAWESTVLGVRKRDLLMDVLPVVGQNLRFQRLFTEYQDQLELLRLK